MDVLKKTFELLVGTEDIRLPCFSIAKKKPQAARPTLRQLIQMESEIGGTLFGEVPRGHRREFFNLDDTTWIWHEEWTDHRGKHRTTTTRYEIHENGILKAQEGARYNFIEGQEFDNFVIATRLYYERVAREVYQSDPHTGKPLQFAAV